MVNRQLIYDRALHALVENVSLGNRGSPRYLKEHVIQPVWEVREALKRRRISIRRAKNSSNDPVIHANER